MTDKKVIKAGFLKMKNDETNKDETNKQVIVEELPDSWWYRVYIAVIITTIIVISALGLFTEIFS